MNSINFTLQRSCIGVLLGMPWLDSGLVLIMAKMLPPALLPLSLFAVQFSMRKLQLIRCVPHVLLCGVITQRDGGVFSLIFDPVYAKCRTAQRHDQGAANQVGLIL
jgi:hypothetical protein